jgi:hypothetical protein
MEEGRLLKEVMKWCPPGRRKRGRPKLEEEYIIIVKWAQENVETLYNLLNK